MASAKTWDRALRTVVFILVLFGSVLMVAPFLFMVSTSLKPAGEVLIQPIQWIPHPIEWSNYVQVFKEVNMWQGFLNSLIVSVTSTTVGLLTTTLAGFAFARLRFPGRKVCFAILLVTMMIPGAVTMIPSFILFRMIHWINTLLPLIIPGFFGGAYGIFLSRQYFMSFPKDLEDAATIDGCNPLRVYWHIFIPNSKPLLATLWLFGFMGAWNDFLGPLIYLNDQNKFTLQLVVASLQGEYGGQFNLLMAGSVISLLPILVIFFWAQRYFVEGITLTGLKG